MMQRDALQNLRPSIPSIVETEDYSEAERFQNECLRPILKFQHELLVAVFQQYIQKRKNKYYELPPAKQLEYIDHSVRQDQKLKNLLVGTIIGHFTLEEYRQYLSLERELRRRITDLLVQRLQDGL